MNIEVLEKRAEVLAKVVACIADLYHDGNLDEGQKGLLETLLGAGIWYLPSGKELFSGKISKAALEQIATNSNIKLVEEHGFPRKVAGKSLFYEHLEDLKSDHTKLYNLYLDKMGRYNLVLKEENNKLKKFQKTHMFISEEEAYLSAGIELISIDEGHYTLPQLKRYNPNTPVKLPKVKKEKKVTVRKTISESTSKKEKKVTPRITSSKSTPKKEKTIVDENSIITHSQNIQLKKGKNDSKTYEAFINYVIDNYSNQILNLDILSKFIKANPIDESFGRDVYYKRIVGHNNWYYSTKFDTATKYSRMFKIADALKFRLELVE